MEPFIIAQTVCAELQVLLAVVVVVLNLRT